MRLIGLQLIYAQAHVPSVSSKIDFFSFPAYKSYPNFLICSSMLLWCLLLLSLFLYPFAATITWPFLSASIATPHSLTLTLLLPFCKAPYDYFRLIIPHIKNLSLNPPARPLLPYKVTYSQDSGIRVWPCFGCLFQPNICSLKININLEDQLK